MKRKSKEEKKQDDYNEFSDMVLEFVKKKNFSVSDLSEIFLCYFTDFLILYTDFETGVSVINFMKKIFTEMKTVESLEKFIESIKKEEK